ncbi:M13 family metallopeptidase [Pseudoxanthomonas wuyuanensis]|uniref:Endothelin-converting enzyme Metallo peptidase. MEROPS family M13 n=1 Tax=Pseudoxanthomonas wuyuanensis TaxID=1073196 RepID=A0A286CWT9_9GAMM|nr:M13-type metalloendopeptidase [Pseudoxanthomonas wuyuanensis]KAF1720891.1 peptidase M13 [Pseudoxanthomonas wuyuanensis]SOD50866.1 endothelin-converting enzyme Metallo peptidase. MEROPS family M13 [Pseudoxanthomonas wuyuanensis]
MKKTLLSAATLLALSLAAPLAAHEDHGCLDDGCITQLLFAEGGVAGTHSGTIAAQRFGSWGIDTAGMDRSARPGEDFFRYVSGTWANTTAIPADRSSYGAFAILRDLSEARLRALVESYPPGNPETDGDAAKIAALYQAFMDEATIETLGSKPVAPLLAAIRAARDKDQLAALMGQRGGLSGSFFGLTVSDDQRDPDRYALYLSQSGLGLGDREMYLRESFAPQRERYQAYIAQMLQLAGWNRPEANAQAILALETRIAQAHWTRAESRDRDKTYNPLALADFGANAPGFPWATFFRAAGVDNAPRAVVRQDSAIPNIAAIYADTDVATLQAWQAFHTVDAAAPLLSQAFVQAEFEFRSKFLSGQPEQRDRWKRGVALAESAMGEAIGRDYVALYFPPDAKAKMDALVANVKAAMGARLDALTWMGPQTKTEARAKLENFGLKIGHPDQWRDYSGLTVRNGDVFGNALRSRQFEWDYRRSRIGQPVDKGEWGMTPQTVNAYYSSVKNEIVFPAAILQPPFFDPDADPAVNYGAIGGVIGHEIIHGFDDQGRKSDGNGLLRDWWTAEDAAKFEAQASKLGAQYEAYTFPQLPGMHINGKVAMGENIGDLGGLTIALEAYRRSLAGKPAPAIDGFSGEQRLFMGWGQVWRTLWRDDALRQQLVNGTHSPGHIRAFAPLRNVDAWYEAFGVTENDPLWIAPEDRVRIW